MHNNMVTVDASWFVFFISVMIMANMYPLESAKRCNWGVEGRAKSSLYAVEEH